jgi:hypothetical protein
LTALSPEHRAYLTAHAVTDQVIDAAGVYSLGQEIVFPWRDGDTVTEQRRPWPGESGQYYWTAGEPLHFWVHRELGPDSPVLLVEGTKQSLAVLSWLPDGYSMYGMTGCEGASRCKLKRFKGRRVVVMLDADSATNLNVYNAGVVLKKRLKFYTSDVVFTQLPARGSTGVDDVLAAEFEPEERTDFLEHLIGDAEDKPASRVPSQKGGGKPQDEGPPGVGDRVAVMVNEDRRDAVNLITATLVSRLGGTELFDYGGLVTRLRGHETQPLDRDVFHSTLLDHVACFNRGESKGGVAYQHAWPDSPTTGAVLSRAEQFPRLERVTRTPFLRPDGSVCSSPGYDAVTGTYLASGSLDGLMVDESPDQDLVKRSAEFLMTGWLGDFPFETEADRANCLALILTPFIRGLVPLMPLAVLNGLHMGVGKNLLADAMWVMATGEVANPLPLPRDEDEMRKQITSVFLGGGDAFVFDEAHQLESAQLARALTSRTYTDRILGVSRQGKFPNNAVWMALGNQVQVNGDMSRRVFHVKLKPSGVNSYDNERQYQHPDLVGWTHENRADLVRACLTVLRGWVCAGSPRFDRGWSMGSFETWDRVMAGVTAYAGFPDFLAHERARRSESDYAAHYWVQHLLWLEREFGVDTPFTTRDVQQRGGSAAQTNPYEGPPDLATPTAEGYTRRLGQAYGRKRDVPMEGGITLVNTGMGHNNTKRWSVVRLMDKSPSIT